MLRSLLLTQKHMQSWGGHLMPFVHKAGSKKVQILKGFKFGRRWLIDKKEFEKWCRSQCS